MSLVDSIQLGLPLAPVWQSLLFCCGVFCAFTFDVTTNRLGLCGLPRHLFVSFYIFPCVAVLTTFEKRVLRSLKWNYFFFPLCQLLLHKSVVACVHPVIVSSWHSHPVVPRRSSSSLETSFVQHCFVQHSHCGSDSSGYHLHGVVYTLYFELICAAGLKHVSCRQCVAVSSSSGLTTSAFSLVGLVLFMLKVSIDPSDLHLFCYLSIGFMYLFFF